MSDTVEEGRVASEYQKWDYINLADFRSTSSWNWVSYVWLWFLSVIAVAVVLSDTFTAVNLLAFNQWSSQVKPAIPISISKWIFAVCILFSWVLLIYEWVRAVRVIRRANVAESYLDPLAHTLQSLRVFGGAQGWRRFLVFAALTKSRKGTDYIAIFTYFQFKGCIRVILAEGPRQVVNLVTLFSVMQAEIIPRGDHRATQGHSDFEQFWDNIGHLYKEESIQALILLAMLFTFVVWVFSALCLLISALLYIAFLWHYIPVDDRSLTRYCRRKVDGRLARIVNVKARTAIEKEEAKRLRAEGKLGIAGATIASVSRAPTLPVASDVDSMSLQRTDTSTTDAKSEKSDPLAGVLRANTRKPKLPTFSASAKERPAMPRSSTESSSRPLLGQAADMGSIQSPAGSSVDLHSGRPPTRSQTPGSQSSMDSGLNRKPIPMRDLTQGSQQSQSSFSSSLPPPTSKESRAATPGRGTTPHERGPPPQGRRPSLNERGAPPHDSRPPPNQRGPPPQGRRPPPHERRAPPHERRPPPHEQKAPPHERGPSPHGRGAPPRERGPPPLRNPDGNGPQPKSRPITPQAREGQSFDMQRSGQSPQGQPGSAQIPSRKDSYGTYNPYEPQQEPLRPRTASNPNSDPAQPQRSLTGSDGYFRPPIPDYALPAPRAPAAPRPGHARPAQDAEFNPEPIARAGTAPLPPVGRSPAPATGMPSSGHLAPPSGSDPLHNGYAPYRPRRQEEDRSSTAGTWLGQWRAT